MIIFSSVILLPQKLDTEEGKLMSQCCVLIYEIFFLKVLIPHVDYVSNYCLHSLHPGAASTAANKGIKDRIYKRHGRWVSEDVKDMYVKDSVHERLSVSLNLWL
jgi:hypothetical protein